MDEKLLVAVTNAQVGKQMLTVERIFKSLDVDCANCNQKFGEHAGLNCPNGKTHFQEKVNSTLEVNNVA